MLACDFFTVDGVPQTDLRVVLHRDRRQDAPRPRPRVINLQHARITRRKILGGLINEYSQVA
jgi:hypothetical protein